MRTAWHSNVVLTPPPHRPHLTHLIILLLVRVFSGADDLAPYTSSHHHHTRTLRDIRECHDVQSKDEIFEKVASSTAAKSIDVKIFTDDVKTSFPYRFAYGHVTVVSDPLNTLDTYEPNYPGSCTEEVTPQQNISDAARQHSCVYAVNGNFFNVSTGNCLGNLISEGRVAVNAGGIMNPNLGITRSGNIIVGYLTEEHVLDMDFKTLVQGVIWLVRAGKNYVKESMEMECADAQTTGDMKTFVEVFSTRTAIGHDSQGNIILVHVEGKTNSGRGVNLYEFADILLDHGVINAINLDGGSSAHVWYNNSIINYPTSHCADSKYRCERPLSAIICVHETPTNCFNNCTGHGVCHNGRCLCRDGFVGSHCQISCPDGYYGNDCNLKCNCTHGVCNVTDGSCSCLSGFAGVTCEDTCVSGTWGINCNMTCRACSNHGSCDAATGQCLCSVGWQGKICQIWRGTISNKLTPREAGLLAVLIGLVALCLTSISFNVYFYLKSKKKTSRYKSRRAPSTRSPRLPAAEISPQEHRELQIPIYHEIKKARNRSAGDGGGGGSVPMATLGHVNEPKPGNRYEAEDVLELIDKEMDGLGEEDFSEWDDTATLLPR